MALFNSFADLPMWGLLALTFVLSSMVGSFLNVVIYRYPIMLENEYQAQAREILELPHIEIEKFGLLLPRSNCRYCGHLIGVLENIPLVSYLLMRGRCRGCKKKISPYYFVTELLTGLLGVWVVWHFGYSSTALFGLFFVWSLVALTGIDIKVQLLPDIITLSLMWGGIILAFYDVYIPLETAVLGAVIGYLVLWITATTFKLITKREGMGLGDAKLLAAIFAWVNIKYLPVVLLIACVVGIVIAVMTRLLRGNKLLNQPIPFGPYLAMGGFLGFLYGNEIMLWYLGLMGIHPLP